MQHLGEGAFGDVKLALEKSTNRQVAIKAVNIMKTCELNKERHIIRERDLLHELKHPNIIELFTTFKVSLKCLADWLRCRMRKTSTLSLSVR